MNTASSDKTIPLRFGSKVWQVPQDGSASIRATLPALDDLYTEIDRALSNPTDFDSIDRMIVAGDVVALAVDPSVPSLEQIVPAVAQWLIEHGVPPDNLHIVIAGNEKQTADLAQSLKDRGLAAVHVDRHNPDDTNCVSYVAADEEAQAIYINRMLVDADVVIPISCARPRQSIDYLGSFSTFPLFSNRETRGQLYSYSRLSDDSQHQQLIDRSNQAAWWLGLMVGIQVVPAANNNVAAVLCSLLNAVDELAQEVLAKVAEKELSSDLVIACVDAPSQDWLQVAHALHAAARYCQAGGSIVLCTEVSEPIGPSLKRLRDAQSEREQIAKRIAKDNADDALVAGAIFETTRDRHVYFISKHRPETVESMGMGSLGSEEQLIHIARQHSGFLVIHSAQHG